MALHHGRSFRGFTQIAALSVFAALFFTAGHLPAADSASQGATGISAPNEKPAPVVTETVVTELRIVPFQKIQKQDKTLPRGVVQVIQQGRQGRERITYKVKLIGGQPAERTVLHTEVLSPPTPHIERVGTAPLVSERVLTETRPIPFDKEQKSDESLPAGIVRIVREGRDGQEKLTYRVTFVDGKETERIVTRMEVVSPPVNQVEAVGTGKAVPQQPAVNPVH